MPSKTRGLLIFTTHFHLSFIPFPTYISIPCGSSFMLIMPDASCIPPIILSPASYYYIITTQHFSYFPVILVLVLIIFHCFHILLLVCPNDLTNPKCSVRINSRRRDFPLLKNEIHTFNLLICIVQVVFKRLPGLGPDQDVRKHQVRVAH